MVLMNNLAKKGSDMMNTRGRIAENGLREIAKSEKIEEKKMMVVDRSKVTNLRNGPKRCLLRREKKITLEQDVDKLRKKLRHEENVHRALERAFTRPLGALPRLPPYLPSYTLELLAEVAVLEEEVVRLEDQVMNFRQGLYQEAIYLSSSRKAMQNELHLSFLSSKKLNFSLAEGLMGKENQSNKHSLRNLDQSPLKNASRILCSEKVGRENVVRSIHDGLNDKECKEASRANKLSEEILRCLFSIFARISLLKNTISVQSEIYPSVSGSCDTSYQDVGFRDPYNICKQFGERDIGSYKLLLEVDSSSSDVNLISKLSILTRRLKSLLRKLSSVDISELTHQQKLAFWINMYNSCMMIVFVENGIPTVPEMVFALMLKAKVSVGGHLFSAMTIEHFMLRLPYNSKHISPKGLKVGEVTNSSMFGLDWPEPLVTFALSCGSWSSPAVRIYTACQVEKQLEEAKRDYLQAAVGVSKPNRMAIPKLLDWYMFDFAKDIDSLMNWICLQLPNEIRKDAVRCVEMGRRSVVPQPIQVLPYDFRFRYLLKP